jgi:ergothioneine biosynthesis protein EgtB
MGVHRERVADRVRAGALAERFRAVRGVTDALAAPLSAEDALVQSMPDASPTKWHLAHTTWFFETFVLARAHPDRRAFDPAYGYLFNSYYEAVGPRHPRPQRGLLARPPLDDVRRYRAAIDGEVQALLERGTPDALLEVVALGLAHEEQHQELIVTDAKHALASNPLRPAYRGPPPPAAARPPPPMRWVGLAGGEIAVGAADLGFAFDNERPRHAVLLRPYALASRPATCGDWLAFIGDGGYRRPDLWLSDGWAAVQREGWEAPLHWAREGSGWAQYTLGGVRPVDPSEPVAHISYFEADAFARWSGARLPTEAEWEAAAGSRPVEGRFADSGRLHPAAADGDGLVQLFGDVWEWTASAYGPYPGFRPLPGALGEYNGKFMVNQLVLRGGSCATPSGHVRPSYRNFFYPDARWQFSGVRLARDS